MRIIRINIAGLVMIMLIALNVNGQITGNGSSYKINDSIQRQIIKDSLHVGDGVIDQIQEIREVFRQSTKLVYADASLTESGKQQRLSGLKQGANQQIEQLLGKSLFNRYLGLIEARRARQGTPAAVEPLTGVVH